MWKKKCVDRRKTKNYHIRLVTIFGFLKVFQKRYQSQELSSEIALLFGIVVYHYMMISCHLFINFYFGLVFEFHTQINLYYCDEYICLSFFLTIIWSAEICIRYVCEYLDTVPNIENIRKFWRMSQFENVWERWHIISAKVNEREGYGERMIDRLCKWKWMRDIEQVWESEIG